MIQTSNACIINFISQQVYQESANRINQTNLIPANMETSVVLMQIASIDTSE